MGRVTGVEAGLAKAPGYPRLEVASGMASLFVRAARVGASTRSWVPDSVVQASMSIRQTVLPLTVAMTFFCIGTVVTLINGVLVPLGTPDRFSGVVETGLIRETNTWVTMMVCAGVLGSAITADLGARKIREELDAVQVLGIDPIRSLIVPRIVGVAFAVPVLALFSLFVSLFTLYIVGPLLIPNLPTAVFIESLRTYLNPVDLFSYVAKHAVFGLFVGIVACYKGLQTSGGAEGVGRAVNQTVLITFFAAWLGNSLWNLAVLALSPGLSALRG